MKKTILALLLFSCTLHCIAQFEPPPEQRIFKKFKTDVSIGYAGPQGSGTKGGGLIAIEPKYALMDQLSIGLRFETAVTVYIDLNGDETKSEANGSYLLTGDYYFNNNKFRPFAGLGAGVYATAFVDETIFFSEDPPTTLEFGFMPRVGFEYGHFRMGLEYNIVPTGDGYLGIKAGFCIGGGRLKFN